MATDAYPLDAPGHSRTCPGGTGIFLYNASGQPMRANLNGTIYRYVYSGERVLEQTGDTGDLLTRYATADGGY